MTTKVTDRCLCGAIGFEVKAPVTCVNCHCESCRRQCSAPMTTYIGVDDSQWRWTRGKPKIYHSSPGVERSFCENCGTPLSFRSSNLSGVMHLYLATLEDPEAFAPELHVSHEERLSWLDLTDDLPKRHGPSYR